MRCKSKSFFIMIMLIILLCTVVSSNTMHVNASGGAGGNQGSSGSQSSGGTADHRHFKWDSPGRYVNLKWVIRRNFSYKLHCDFADCADDHGVNGNIHHYWKLASSVGTTVSIPWSRTSAYIACYGLKSSEKPKRPAVYGNSTVNPGINNDTSNHMT